MALQTANQFQLGTDFSQFGRGVQQGQQIAGQFQIGQERDAESGRQADQARVLSVVQGASNIQNIPTDSLKLDALLKRRGDLIQKELPTQDTDEVIALFQAGRNEEANALIAGVVNAGIQQGLLKGGAAGPSALEQAQTAKTIAQTGQIGVEKPATKTSLEKNLIAAGFTPGTKEFQAEVQKFIEKPTGTTVSIGGEQTFKKEVAKSHAKTFSRVGEQADAAIDANQSLKVLENIDVNTGALEPAKQALAAFGAAFGLDTNRIANVSAGEGFNAEAQRLVLAVKASQKGPQTDKDEATIRDTVANLGNTKAGNQFIINSARALNNRRIERKDFYDKFIEDAGGNFKDETGKTADRAWAEFKRSTPMISSNLRTPEGLPVFFYRFDESVRAANPDATRAEIVEAWKIADKGAK